MKTYIFSENHSGGSFWLKRADYEALARHGWTLPTNEDKPFYKADDDVPYNWRHNIEGAFNTIREAVEAFEKATGRDFFEQGCSCRGAPFSINSYEYGEYISGDSVGRTVVRPW